MTEKLFNEYEIKNELQKIEQWKLVVKSGGLISPYENLPDDDFLAIEEGLENTERFEAPPSDELPGDDFVVYIPEGLNNTELREEPPAEELAGENFGINWSSDTTEDVEGKNLDLEGIDFRAEHDNYFGDTSTLVNTWESHSWSDSAPLNANDNNINSNFEDDFSEFKWTPLTDNTQLHDGEAIGLESSSLETNGLNDGLTKDLTQILTENVGALCCPGGTSY